VELSKLWVAAIGMVIGAIAGGWIWASHVAGEIQKSAGTGDDALVNTAQSLGAHSAGAALQGAFVGGIIGLALAVAYLYFTDSDRGMVIRKIEVHDD
jgi:hypothetical protein